MSFRLRSEGKGKLVRAVGLEPLTDLAVQRIFIPVYGFRRRPPLSQWGLGSGLSLHRARIWLRVSGAARLVSTPSRRERFPPGLARDRHFTGFPEFEQFCTAGFPAGTRVFSQVLCVCRFRHPGTF